MSILDRIDIICGESAGKTVILVAHEEQEVAFDLRGQRRQTYTSIYELREQMTDLIGDLTSICSSP